MPWVVDVQPFVSLLFNPKDNKPLTSATTKWLHPRVVIWVKAKSDSTVLSLQKFRVMSYVFTFQKGKTKQNTGFSILDTYLIFPWRDLFKFQKVKTQNLTPLLKRNLFLWKRSKLFPFLRRVMDAWSFLSTHTEIHISESLSYRTILLQL